jgi:hypothetical protein
MRFLERPAAPFCRAGRPLLPVRLFRLGRGPRAFRQGVRLRQLTSFRERPAAPFCLMGRPLLLARLFLHILGPRHWFPVEARR